MQLRGHCCSLEPTTKLTRCACPLTLITAKSSFAVESRHVPKFPRALGRCGEQNEGQMKNIKRLLVSSARFP